MMPGMLPCFGSAAIARLSNIISLFHTERNMWYYKKYR